MTTKELISWIYVAYDNHQWSCCNDVSRKPICLKKALIESKSMYNATDGELELAIIIIYTCSFDQLGELQEKLLYGCVPVDPEPTPVVISPFTNPYTLTNTEREQIRRGLDFL